MWNIHKIWKALSILDVSVTFYKCRSSGSRSISAFATCCCPYKCECIFHFDSFSVVVVVVAVYRMLYSASVSYERTYIDSLILFSIYHDLLLIALWTRRTRSPRSPKSPKTPAPPSGPTPAPSPRTLSSLFSLSPPSSLYLPSWKQVVTFPP